MRRKDFQPGRRPGGGKRYLLPGALDFGSGAEYSGMEEQGFLRFLRNTYLSLMGEYI